MATTKFYLDMRGRAKDGKGSILISVFHNQTTATIPTAVRVAPNEWNGEQVVRREDAALLNAKLSKKKFEIDTSIAALSLAESLDDFTAADIKHFITSEKKVANRHFVSELFEEYMNTGLSEGTKEIYRTTLRKVLDFGGSRIRVESINVKWLYDFEQHLAKTQGINGRSIYLRSLRCICNYARKTGVITTYPFENFQIKSEPTRKRSVELELFRKFLSYPVTGKQKVFRDYFLLSFYLIGINMVDLLTATPDCLESGRLNFFRRKTHKHYSIKVEPEAYEIVNRYRGEKHLLEALDHCRHHKCFIHMMNDSLKTIGPEQEVSVNNETNLFEEKTVERVVNPIIPGITSYYARHTWATLASELDIPFDTISQALGHSSGNRTTLIYIRYDQQKIDDANRRVIDYVTQHE